MHALTLLSVVLAALATLAEANTHIHRPNHRGVHRRHHARAQDTASAPHAARRRACPAKSGSASSSASASSASAASSSASSAITTSSAATSSVAKPSSTPASSSAEAAPTSSAKASPAASSSSSSNAAASTPAVQQKAAAGSAATALLASLFPVSNALSSWSTASDPNARSTTVALSDASIRATRILSGVTHAYVDWQGKRAMEAFYPQGAYNFQNEPRGGFSLYAYGPESVDLTTAREATLGYSVWFEDGFEFNMGGKIPGFWGGDDDEGSISCSGGARSNKCFSSRLMWRTPKNGVAEGELYTYLPPSAPANEKLCNVPPYSDCNTKYGASVARGAFQIQSGRWVTLTQRIKLNDVGVSNGEIEVWAGGQSVISISGLVLRTSDAGRIRGIMMQTFFGGSQPIWASQKDQRAYFADFSVAITKKF